MAALSSWMYFLVAVCFLALCLVFREIAEERRRMLAAAVSVALGYTTIENLIAVLAAANPLGESVARLLTIPAGHVALQLVMGYFAAKMVLSSKHRIIHGFLLLAVLVAIHGMGDFSEALFHHAADRDPDSTQTRLLFSCWILSLFVYVAAAVAVL